MDKATIPKKAVQEELHITNPETYASFADDVAFVIQQNDIPVAYEFVTGFTPLLRSSKLIEHNPELHQKYEELIWRASWIALPILSDAEVVDLFEKHLLLAFTLRDDPPFDFWDSLKSKLRNVLIIEERTPLKQKIKEALLRNQERITNIGPRIEGKEEFGTLVNWFRDYHRNVGMGTLDRVRQSQYFARGESFQKLTDQEKERLKTVFNLYEKLKFPSLTPAGFEDPIGVDDEENQGTIRDGVFERLDLTVARKIADAMKTYGFAKSSLDTQSPRTAIPQTKVLDPTNEQQRLRSLQKESSALFFDLLAPPQGMRGTTQEELLAGLMILAEENALEKTLTDPKVKELFVVYLKTKKQSDLLEGFRLAPAMPKYVILFLQWVLQEKGKMSENDAAQFAVQLVNILKKQGNEKYARIAYYDAASGQFRWS